MKIEDELEALVQAAFISESEIMRQGKELIQKDKKIEKLEEYINSLEIDKFKKEKDMQI